MNALLGGSIAEHLFIPKRVPLLPTGPKEDTETELTRAGRAAGLGQAQTGDTWQIKWPTGGSSHSKEQFKLFIIADGPELVITS